MKTLKYALEQSLHSTTQVSDSKKIDKFETKIRNWNTNKAKECIPVFFFSRVQTYKNFQTHHSPLSTNQDLQWLLLKTWSNRVAVRCGIRIRVSILSKRIIHHNGSYTRQSLPSWTDINNIVLEHCTNAHAAFYCILLCQELVHTV